MFLNTLFALGTMILSIIAGGLAGFLIWLAVVIIIANMN